MGAMARRHHTKFHCRPSMTVVSEFAGGGWFDWAMNGVPSRQARLAHAAKHAELWNAGKKDEWVASWRTICPGEVRMFDPVGTEEKRGFETATSDAFDMFQLPGRVEPARIHGDCAIRGVSAGQRPRDVQEIGRRAFAGLHRQALDLPERVVSELVGHGDCGSKQPMRRRLTAD